MLLMAAFRHTLEDVVAAMLMLFAMLHYCFSADADADAAAAFRFLRCFSPPPLLFIFTDTLFAMPIFFFHACCCHTPLMLSPCSTAISCYMMILLPLFTYVDTCCYAAAITLADSFCHVMLFADAASADTLPLRYADLVVAATMLPLLLLCFATFMLFSCHFFAAARYAMLCAITPLLFRYAPLLMPPYYDFDAAACHFFFFFRAIDKLYATLR